jgi:hypothetical protein
VLVVFNAHVQHEVPHDNLNKEYQWQQAKQVRVLVVFRAHVQHEVPHAGFRIRIDLLRIRIRIRIQNFF